MGVLAQISQLSSGDLKMLYIFTGLFIVAFIVLVIFVKIFGGGKSKGDSINLDTNFLDRLEGTGGLTPEEKKRVREAMVRQALREQQARETGAKNLSVKDLSMLASQGPEALDEQSTIETGKKVPKKSYAEERRGEVQEAAPKKEARSLEEIRRRKAEEAAKAGSDADKAQNEEKPAPEKPAAKKTPPELPAAKEEKPKAASSQGGGSIDLDRLLERGLIDPEEYDRLKQLAEESAD
ncbi:MAG: hypothetical protein ACOC29_03630 [Candidatus Sumerlaeota bacterium]